MHQSGFLICGPLKIHGLSFTDAQEKSALLICTGTFNYGRRREHQNGKVNPD
jgi:hypothetical protein